MKTRSFFAVLFFAAALLPAMPLFSQKPETVFSIVKVDKPVDWYLSQAALWKKMIDADPKNTAAWLNFYTANRMARLTCDSLWRAKKGPGFMEPDTIVQRMQRAVPGTYEYYNVKVWNDGFQDQRNATDLLKAYEMNPDRPAIYSSLVNYYEMKRDRTHEAEICRKWFESNDISPNILNYNYNVLQSVDDNGILITNGDNDTYPLWILQYALGIKPHVVVVNINLVTVDSYRKKLFEENGIPADGFRALEQPEQQNILRHLVARSGRPVFFANTLNTGYYEEFKSNLYMVGLAYKYAKESFDNIAVARHNFERNYLTDYLRIGFGQDLSQGIADRMNMGYLPMLIKLYEHYSLAGEEERAASVKELAARIARKGDPEMNIGEYFKKR
jgi:hypothetical protein